MFGREKVECPGCKKVFRKKHMKTRCMDTKGRYSKYYHQYSCTDCCVKKSTINVKADAEKDAEDKKISLWKAKCDPENVDFARCSDKLSRLFQEWDDLFWKRSDTRSRLGQAETNVIDATNILDDCTVANRRTSLLGVAWDLLDESYKSRPGYQTAVAEKGRIEASLNDLDRAITKNQNETLKEIGRIEKNGNKEPDENKEPVGITESNVKRLQNLMDNTISEVINRAEQHSSNWQTKRDGIKEPVEQNNDNSFCEKCGKSLKKTAKFCGSCGTSVP